METILQEWEKFAATLVAAEQRTDHAMLRDHGERMLETIAADLARPESAHEKAEKSKGRGESHTNTETAAETHGADRLALGFSLNAAVAEYRALRASVIRLWQEALRKTPAPARVLDDLIRFSEAIDQAITESVTSYSFEKEQKSRMFDAILSSSPDLICTVDLKGRFAYANRALIEFFDLSREEEVVGKTFRELGVPQAVELQRQIRQVISSKESSHGELAATTPAAQRRFYDYIFVPVFNKEGAVEAVTGTLRDITERKLIEDKNWRRANYDILTGLPNRRLFLDRLEQDVKHAARIGTPLALLYIDLDRFKEANDKFGHNAGDLLLRFAADRIRSCVRQTDTVARLGGDEFTVILQDLVHSQYAENVAGKIVKELSTPFQIAKDTINISASIGITLSSRERATPDELLKKADRAMYAAKSAGRNRVALFSQARKHQSH